MVLNRFCIHLLALLCLPFAALAAETDFQPPMLDRPYAPLMIPIGGGPVEPFPSPEEIERIAHTYVFINSHGGMVNPSNAEAGMMAFPLGSGGGATSEGLTLNQALKALNPAFTASNYRNGSWVQQNCPNEAAEVETRFPLGISCWKTSATLAQDIAAVDTSFLVTNPGPVPEGFPPIYPFKASTIEAEHSQTPQEYVAWVRLGEEIVRIDSIKPVENGLVFTVRRGIWGTEPAAHPMGIPVFQPVYIGSVRAGADTALSGVPDNTSPQLGIRYGLQLQNEEFQKWLAEKCQLIFDAGYDVAWLDITESNWYNNGDAYAQPVTPWNFEAGALMTHDAFRESQQQKLDYLYSVFPDKHFWCNNIKGNHYFQNGHEQYLLSGAGGHHPVSGGSMEVYANTTNPEWWRNTVSMTLDFVKNDFWGVAWSKGGQERLADYRRFAYSTFLLAFEPGRKRPLMFARGEGDSLLGEMEDYFYYDLGRPIVTYESVDSARHPQVEGVYHRSFENGYVVVNASGDEHSVALEQAMHDPEQGAAVESVTLQPWTAAILLKNK